MDFTERSTRVYRTKQLYTKEELAARESLCVHEQPAFCAAACPLRLDARELLGHTAKGELAQARAMLERATPFPGILAAGCEAPCRAACRLNEIPGGQSVDIPAVERAAMRHGAARTGRGLLKFKKKKTAAVFGAELFTLIVAGELAAKSYPTKFFVAEGSAEELMDKCAPFLSPEDRAAEIKRLAAMDIELEFGSELTPELVRGAGADIVCVSREVLALLDKSAAPDEVTLWCESLGVLARAGENGGVISAFYDALRAGGLPNVFNPAFAGGALMDINLYNLYFAYGLFGVPEKLSYHAHKHANGIDTSGVLVLEYPDFVCQCTGAKDCQGAKRAASAWTARRACAAA